jgi:hypothetical protein
MSVILDQGFGVFDLRNKAFIVLLRLKEDEPGNDYQKKS